MNTIEDSTTEELDIIKKTVAERFGEEIETVLADTELRLDKAATELTT